MTTLRWAVALAFASPALAEADWVGGQVVAHGNALTVQAMEVLR